MDNNDNLLEEILASMKGSSPAIPPADLFSKLERKLNKPTQKIVPIRQIILRVAAVFLLIAANVLVVKHYTQTNNTNTTIQTSSPYSPIVSNFKLYE